MKFYHEAPLTGNEEYDRMMFIVFEMHKYKHMWHLRHLEKEIEESGGILLLKQIDGKVKFILRQFPPDLVEKILEATNSLD